MNVELKDLWTAAGVLIGFQLTAFTWRISREIAAAQKREINWLPVADFMNLVSMLTIVFGVFILPILGVSGLTVANRLFGLGLVLFGGYPFAVAGHYRLYKKERGPRCRFPLQERFAICLTGIAAIVYIIFAIR